MDCHAKLSRFENVAVEDAGGIPLKLDTGGTVLDARPKTRDYFLADIDAFRGASGSGVFNAEGVLVGILARGNADFVRTESGCRKAVRLSNDAGKEQVMYVQQAIQGLCAVEPSYALCAADCEQPCHDRFTPPGATHASCTLGRTAHSSGNRAWAALAIALFVNIVAARRRRTKRVRHHILDRRFSCNNASLALLGSE